MTTATQQFQQLVSARFVELELIRQEQQLVLCHVAQAKLNGSITEAQAVEAVAALKESWKDK